MTKLKKILLVEYSILLALGITLADLTADFVAVKIYPIPEQTQIIEELTTQEHICNATDGQNCQVLYNLCQKESGCRRFAVNKNTNGTYDHSWYQINDVHIIGEPESKGKGTISMDCVYDLYCASKWANDQINQGRGHIWVAWHKI